MRRWSITALALLASVSIAAPGRACGFEDPKSASIQRVMLGVVYPDALHVLGAVDTALRDGAIKPGHFTRAGDLFALQRTIRNLRRLADGLGGGAIHELPRFSVVLMGPVLWTRFRPSSEGVAMGTHVAGPLEDGVVVVTDVPALAALVTGDVSGSYAAAAGLVRFYGDRTDIDRLRAALVVAFPAGIDHASRGSVSGTAATAR